ncbi:MAG: peroxidase [Verrucomicrobia bacterium]|nr:peroxidase [Verrucomicrobiota bacterium]
MTQSQMDYSDVQGLVRFGYKRMTEASYVLLRIKDVAVARSWLRVAPVTTAIVADPPPSTAMQVAFTAAGLKALGVPDAVVAGFSSEFLEGMTEESRSRRLGDAGSSAPSEWAWGNSGSMPHLVVMFFAEPGRLNAFFETSTGKTWNEAFDVLRSLDTSDLGGIEPFGFTDGISQPQINWAQERDLASDQIDYTNVAALGEFLLGYRNEYNHYTDRPLIDANAESAGLLSAEDVPGKKDVGRNGTYLVMRDLRQDVRRFWQFINRQADGDSAEVDRLAAAFVGRTRTGDPLIPIQKEAIPGIGSRPDQIRQNQFTFDQDPAGTGCPLGAHIRRANPRNADYPGHPTGLARLLATVGFGPRGFRDDLLSSVRFHRILRRGREYGPRLSPSDALTPAPPDDPERGLRFLCLNANISRQFEFLQNAWVMNTEFSGLTGESDPLLGNRQTTSAGAATDSFTRQKGEGLRCRVSGVPQFVTVRGGAYFFLPSLRTLRYFTS